MVHACMHAHTNLVCVLGVHAHKHAYNLDVPSVKQTPYVDFLLRGWNTWCEEHARHMKLLNLGQHVILRWRRLRLAKAFDSFHEHFLEMIAMKESTVRMVSLDIPVTDRRPLLLSRTHRSVFENDIKAQVCSTLNVPSDSVSVFVVCISKTFPFCASGNTPELTKWDFTGRSIAVPYKCR